MKHIKGSLFAIVTFLMLIPTDALSQTVFVKLEQIPDISLFSKAIVDSGLDSELKNDGTYTIFAPSNTVFKKEISDKKYSVAKLKSLLLNHIMTGWATEKNLKSMSKATSLGGITLKIVLEKDEVIINDAHILKKNIKAKNGVIHIIDHVLK